VEDDQTTCDVIRAYLESAGHRVVLCRTGSEALDVVRRTAPRCLILDVMLPGKDGFEICDEIRRAGSIVPILFLSARSGEPDRVDGLRVGADDYLVKPFSPRELVARVDALLRRAEIGPQPPSVLRLGNVELSPGEREVAVEGQRLALTQVEFGLLAAMLERPGWVLTRTQLIDRLYSNDRFPALERTVDVHVFRLREKLVAARSSASIVTIRGVGYKITAEGG
jgi:two-component system alkaline phosphatase synthesis response regulator PhoP